MPEASLSQSDNGPVPGFDPQDIFDNAPIGITSTPGVVLSFSSVAFKVSKEPL